MKFYVYFAALFITGGLSFQKADEEISWEKNVTTLKNGYVIKLNFAVDMMLNVARLFFTKHGQLTINLPKINKTFGHDFYKGLFTAYEGYFRNIGSLHRTGDVAFSAVGKSLALQVAMGLSEMEAGYDNYTLNIVNIHQSGNLTLSCAENSLMMKFNFTYSPKCMFFLEYIRFDKLTGIKAEINGLGAFQMLYNELSTWLISNFEERFRKIANKKMHERLETVLSKKSDMFCKYFPHF